MLVLKMKDHIKPDEVVGVSKYLERWDDHPAHTHEFIELVYIWSGNGHHMVNGKDYFVSKGDLIFMNLGDSHRHYSKNEIGIFNCYIDPGFFMNELLNEDNILYMLVLDCMKEYSETEYLPPHVSFTQPQDMADIEVLLGLIKEETINKSEGYKIAVKIYLTAFITKIFRAMKRINTVNNTDVYNKIKPQILEYIKDNYNTKINLYHLAKENLYSPNYFSKLFKDCFGKSFTQYINDLRIQEATKLLKDSQMSIEQISGEVGYMDKTQFYKVFKSYMNMTPLQYRRMLFCNYVESIKTDFILPVHGA